MHQFSHLSIRFKVLAIVFGGILGLTITLAFNYNANFQNKSTLENIRNIYFPILERLDANIVRLDSIKELYSSSAIMGEEDMLLEITGIAKMFTKILKEVSSLNNLEINNVKKIQQEFDDYSKIADLLSRGMIDESLDLKQMQGMQKEMAKKLQLLEKDLHQFRKQSYLQFTSAIEQANRGSSDSLYRGIVIGVVTALVLAISGVYIGNSIVNNINSVGRSLNAMAKGRGDLKTRLVSNSHDEISDLVDGFNEFIGKLELVIQDVKNSSTDVADASEEMKKISQMSVIGMNTQKEEIGKVVTSMAEMTNSVMSVSESANNAADIASVTRDEASVGRTVVEGNMESIGKLAKEVEHAASVIEELDKHSESIGSVMNVIRGIAEQTNLLALNAAIEAARAGEQGRGFAVVADEVRTLATRTHESTQEIDEMISRLQSGTSKAVQTMIQGREQAQASVDNAEKVHESLDKIARGIAEISDMNKQIAVATDEQNSFAQEINNNIMNLGQVVYQISDDAHNAEKTSEKVAELAVLLKKEVSVFGV